MSGDGWFQGKPAAVSWGPGRIDVAVHGMDDALWVISWVDGRWGGFWSLGGLLYRKGELVSSPAIASRGVNRLDLRT